ncbi:MAG: hypothetical protein ACYC27_22400 [Armatimonadota bacterium]
MAKRSRNIPAPGRPWAGCKVDFYKREDGYLYYVYLEDSAHSNLIYDEQHEL